MIAETPIRLGNVYDERFGPSFGGNLWSLYGIAPTLKSSGSVGQEFIVVEVRNDRGESNWGDGQFKRPYI